MTQVAWIGLGAMGSRMAAHLRDAGHELTVWNRTRDRAEELGVPVAWSPRMAAEQGKVVFTMLADPDALREVTEGEDGILAGLRDGAVLVEMSTVGPDAIGRLAEAFPEGAALLDVPVLGSLAEAEAATLKLFVGGEDEPYVLVRPLLETLGEPLRVGPLGSGAAAKLVANAALLGTLVQLGETLRLADLLGLGRDRAFDVLAATPLAAQAERRREAIESGEYPARFRLSLARKDAGLVADAAGGSLPVLEAVRSRFASAESAGLGDADYAAVLAWILGDV